MSENKELREDILSVINANFEIERGMPTPFGATLVRGGINFAVYSPHAHSVSIVLYTECAGEPLMEFPLDPDLNRTGFVWHAYIKGLNHGVKYGFRLRG